MKKLIFLVPILLLFSCKTEKAQENTLTLGLTPGEKDKNYSFRAFTGPTMQFGRTGQEVIALKLNPKGIILGESYQSFEQGVSFTDLSKAETRNIISGGQYNPDGQYVFVVNYNNKETAIFRGTFTDNPYLETRVTQKAIDGITQGKTAMEIFENTLFNEIIDEREVINPQYTDGFSSSFSEYSQLRANIHYPQIIGHPKQEVIETFNLGIQKQVANRANTWFESQSGDEGAEFYKKRGELKFVSNSFNVVHFDADRLSYIDTISFMDPAMASPRVYLMSYNYDFKQNKALQITDILSKNINHKDFLQKKIMEDLPKNPNKDALKILMSFELEDFQDWTFDKETLTLYYLPFGEWTYYNVVKGGIPSVSIKVAENKAAFK